MAKYGSNSLVIEFDNAGGTPVDMSQYILEVNGMSVESMMEESHTFGDSWREHLPTGLRQVGDLEWKGFFDDTATSGPDAIFNAPATGPSTTSRTAKYTWGGTKTSSVETFIARYDRNPVRGQLTKFTVQLKTTGAVTEV